MVSRTLRTGRLLSYMNVLLDKEISLPGEVNGFTPE